MENATKALMIAGAVLIAIMIIGVGMMIYQSGAGTVTKSIEGLTRTEIDAFNADLLAYEGDQKGSNVKQLISKIVTLNSTNAGVNDDRVISFNGKTAANDLATERTAIVTGKTYTVSVQYNEGGLITTITCAEKGKK